MSTGRVNALTSHRVKAPSYVLWAHSSSADGREDRASFIQMGGDGGVAGRPVRQDQTQAAGAERLGIRVQLRLQVTLSGPFRALVVAPWSMRVKWAKWVKIAALRQEDPIAHRRSRAPCKSHDEMAPNGFLRTL